jgi:Na+-translocating ferredoxin:NAD+ oxidoreductase RnfC subunit
MNRSKTTLRIDAAYGPKIKPGDKIRRGQNISTNQKQKVTSPLSGTVESVRFDRDNHEFLIVVSFAAG